jgi:hypothetical protein
VALGLCDVSSPAMANIAIVGKHRFNVERRYEEVCAGVKFRSKKEAAVHFMANNPNKGLNIVAFYFLEPCH